MLTRRLLVAMLAVAAAACSSSDSGGSGGSGSGGQSTGSGGTIGSGGHPGTGGSSAAGGSNGTGGSGSGGHASTGGVTGSGGSTATGGTTSAQSGGATGSGGKSGSGGSTGNGGSVAGGSTGMGGSTAIGGSTGKGGSTGNGGRTGNGGSTGSGGTGIDGGGGGGGDAVPSKGCGKTDGAKTLTAGGSKVTGAPTTSTRLSGVTSGGKARLVIIDIPADYDPTKPYRLVFSWRQMGGSDTGNATGLHPAGDGPNFDAEHYAYFGLRREALNAKQPAIFVAPDTDPAGGLWDYNKDSVYFDDLLKLVTDNLCIDESRVFTTGFSYGAMMSYGLSNGRPSKLRAAVTMAPSQFGPSAASGPIAYMSTTGMDDGTCRWGDANSGGEGCVMTHAKANGCTIPATLPTAAKGSKKYVCYDFEGCKAGYPVKVCTFDGPHTPSSIDDGSTVGEDGLKAFIPPLAWKFMSQF
jgi:poly(3-hydroxybutyrate) depolymerase